MALRVGSIVQGKGELEAAPLLIRRILAEIHVHDANILKPVRARRDKLLKANRLRSRARALRSDVPIHAVVAHVEYETWFLAGVNTLGGKRGLQNNLPNPPSAEGVQNPKRWLTDYMTGSRAYSETADQATFSATFDMMAARRNSRSFDKFYRTVCEIAGVVPRPR